MQDLTNAGSGVRLTEEMSPGDYRSLLLEREVAQAAHRAVAKVVDAPITLSCPGPALVWPGDVEGETPSRSPTGDPVFNMASSILFAPAVILSLGPGISRCALASVQLEQCGSLGELFYGREACDDIRVVVFVPIDVHLKYVLMPGLDSGCEQFVGIVTDFQANVG